MACGTVEEEAIAVSLTAGHMGGAVERLSLRLSESCSCVVWKLLVE